MNIWLKGAMWVCACVMIACAVGSILLVFALSPTFSCALDIFQTLGIAATPIAATVVSVFLYKQNRLIAKEQEAARIRSEQIALFDKRLEMFRRLDGVNATVRGLGLVINIRVLFAEVISEDMKKQGYGDHIDKYLNCFDIAPFCFTPSLGKSLKAWSDALYAFLYNKITRNIDAQNQFDAFLKLNMKAEAMLDEMEKIMEIYKSSASLETQELEGAL